MDPEDIKQMTGQMGDLTGGLGLNITPSAIIAGLIFGIIGFILFRQGKRKLNYVWVICGLSMMVYPIFTMGNPWGDWGVGIALCGVAYYYRD